MVKKWPLYLTFYKQTFIYSVATGGMMYILPFQQLTNTQRLTIALVAFTGIGLALYVLMEHIRKTNDAYFYFNQGVTKLQLYAFSLVLNLIVAIIIYLVFK